MEKMNKKAVLGLKSMIIAVLVITIFAFYLIGFATEFISITNPSSPVLTHGGNLLLNSSNSINNSLTGINNLGNSVSNTLAKSQPSATDYLFLIFQGAFTIPISIFLFIGSGLSMMVSVFFGFITSNGLSIAMPLLTAVFAGLIIIAVLIVIRFIRTGSE